MRKAHAKTDCSQPVPLPENRRCHCEQFLPQSKNRAAAFRCGAVMNPVNTSLIKLLYPDSDDAESNQYLVKTQSAVETSAQLINLPQCTFPL
jgi:hypothetical protein